MRVYEWPVGFVTLSQEHYSGRKRMFPIVSAFTAIYLCRTPKGQSKLIALQIRCMNFPLFTDGYSKSDPQQTWGCVLMPANIRKPFT